MTEKKMPLPTIAALARARQKMTTGQMSFPVPTVSQKRPPVKRKGGEQIG